MPLSSLLVAATLLDCDTYVMSSHWEGEDAVKYHIAYEWFIFVSLISKNNIKNLN